MKPIFWFGLAACIVIGYYAWRQQQQTIGGLQLLKDSGVNITIAIQSRPLLAVDAQHQRFYLIKGSMAHEPTVIDFPDIAQVVFRETPEATSDNSEPRGPDTITIHLHDGSQYRVGDLPGRSDGARRAFNTFKQNRILTDKLSFRAR